MPAGLLGSMMWVAQGQFIKENSSEATLGRNGGLFWLEAYMHGCCVIVAQVDVHGIVCCWQCVRLCRHPIGPGHLACVAFENVRE